MTRRALIVIDLQNDYFPGGNFPLWNTEAVLQNVERAIARARSRELATILVQHVGEASRGPSSFLSRGTPGVEVHPRILAAASGAPVVVKRFADAFDDTTLEATLSQLGATGLLVCGMMTQNCVTHTVLSRAAEKYQVTVLPDCCTTVTEMIHLIALSALSRRVRLVPLDQAL